MSDVVMAIQTAIEIVEELRAISKKVEDAEFKMLLADLSGELADAKLELANLKMELASAREQLLQKSELLERKGTDKPNLCEGTYQFPDDPGFFCTACYDTKKAASTCQSLVRAIYYLCKVGVSLMQGYSRLMHFNRTLRGSLQKQELRREQ